MLLGRVSRKCLLAHPKTNSSKFRCQTRLELQKGLDYAQMKQTKKKSLFLAANPPDRFGANMSTVKYTAGSLNLWAFFSGSP